MYYLNKKCEGCEMFGCWIQSKHSKRLNFECKTCSKSHTDQIGILWDIIKHIVKFYKTDINSVINEYENKGTIRNRSPLSYCLINELPE